MSRELICNWLNLPTDRWPPDYYTLVGLKPGETDPARIEQHVHERHECLLRYQLTHPEVVTEALNFLAKAFVCLTDPEAKKAYDATLFPERAPSSTPVQQPAPDQPAAPDPLVWLYGPWGQGSRETVVSPSVSSTPADGSPALPAPPAVPVPPAVNPARPSASVDFPMTDGPEDPVVRVAGSPIARRGLGTKRALYFRISRTRQLLRAWIAVGQYVGSAAFVLQKRSDAVDLRRQLDLIRELLRGFPPLLGQAGQPGYLVVALARQPMIVQTFLGLLPSQREAIVRDWQAGLTLLAAHRLVLREEIWSLRRRGLVGRTMWALRALVGEHPGMWLLLAILAVLNIVFAPPSPLLVLQAGAILGILVFYLWVKSLPPQRSWLHRRQRQRPVR